MEEPGLLSLSVSEQDAIDCVPDSICFYDSYLEGKNYYMEKLLRRRKLRLGAKCFHVLKTLSMG